MKDIDREMQDMDKELEGIVQKILDLACDCADEGLCYDDAVARLKAFFAGAVKDFYRDVPSWHPHIEGALINNEGFFKKVESFFLSALLVALADSGKKELAAKVIDSVTKTYC